MEFSWTLAKALDATTLTSSDQAALTAFFTKHANLSFIGHLFETVSQLHDAINPEQDPATTIIVRSLCDVLYFFPFEVLAKYDFESSHPFDKKSQHKLYESVSNFVYDIFSGAKSATSGSFGSTGNGFYFDTEDDDDMQLYSGFLGDSDDLDLGGTGVSYIWRRCAQRASLCIIWVILSVMCGTSRSPVSVCSRSFSQFHQVFSFVVSSISHQRFLIIPCSP